MDEKKIEKHMANVRLNTKRGMAKASKIVELCSKLGTVEGWRTARKAMGIATDLMRYNEEMLETIDAGRNNIMTENTCLEECAFLDSMVHELSVKLSGMIVKLEGNTWER